MSNPAKTELLLEEYKEAMNQRRHLETMRSSYLGAYFAFLVGLLGLISTLLEKNAVGHWVAISVPIFLSLLSLLTTMIYISTRKISALLGYYDNVTTVVRRRLYGDEEAAELESDFSSYKSRDPVLEKRLFSLTGMIDNFVQFMGFSLLISDAIALIFWYRSGAYAGFEIAILSAICVALSVLMITTRLRVRSRIQDVRFFEIPKLQTSENSPRAVGPGSTPTSVQPEVHDPGVSSQRGSL